MASTTHWQGKITDRSGSFFCSWNRIRLQEKLDGSAGQWNWKFPYKVLEKWGLSGRKGEGTKTTRTLCQRPLEHIEYEIENGWNRRQKRIKRNLIYNNDRIWQDWILRIKDLHNRNRWAKVRKYNVENCWKWKSLARKKNWKLIWGGKTLAGQ